MVQTFSNSPQQLIQALSSITADSRPLALAAWATTARTTAALIDKPVTTAAARAMRHGITAARAASGGRLPKGARACLETHLQDLAVHVYQVRKGRDESAAPPDEYPIPLSRARYDQLRYAAMWRTLERLTDCDD